MRTVLSSLGLALFLSLAGCASVPITSIAPLMRLDMATTDAAALRVALQLPDGLRSRPGGMVLDLVLKVAGAPDREEHFLLVDTEGPADLAGLGPMQRSGFTIAAFRVAAGDVPRFRAIQAALIEARGKRLSGSLGFGIAAREFCLTGAAAPARLVASTYLLAAESQGWLTVTDQFDLGSDPGIAAGLATLGPC